MSKTPKRRRDDVRGSGADQRAGHGVGKKKKNKGKSSAGGGVHPGSSNPGKKTPDANPVKITTRPPPPYRLSSADTDDESSTAVLMPGDEEYDECVTRAYRGFHVDSGEVLGKATHDDTRKAFESMTVSGYFQRDVLAAGGTVSPTFVRRTLVGDTGMTYHYQKLRIFAHPWSDEFTESDSPLRAVRKLNETLIKRSKVVLEENKDMRISNGTIDGSNKFNVTLINLMDPVAEANNSDVPLKDEAKYGMGPTSVSWHSDSSLQNMSTVAVYHTCDELEKKKKPSWHVGLKTLDRVSPALRVPLPNRATYFMLRDFNLHHHHAVLAGTSKRYSSTHRVAVVEKDTFLYIKGKAVDAIGALPVLKKYALNAKQGRSALNKNRDDGEDKNSLAKLTQSIGAIHKELEFQWIRMFWLQGQEHADRHSSYWSLRIDELTQAWDTLELGLRWVLETLRFGSNVDGPSAKSPPPQQRAYDVMTYILTSISEERESLAERMANPAYQKLSDTQKPVRKPKFDDKSPLPENLRPVIASLEGWKKRAKEKERV
tara:strand:+ start:562 stop:2190 length:1629 start_codon:yes stop_codon:yes gene_type:complete